MIVVILVKSFTVGTRVTGVTVVRVVKVGKDNSFFCSLSIYFSRYEAPSG